MTRRRFQSLSVLVIPILVLLLLLLLAPAVAVASPPTDAEAGKTAFDANCAVCHGESGIAHPLEGSVGYFAAYDIPAPVVGGMLIGVVREGIDAKMPSFSEKALPDAEIMGISEYLFSIATEVSVGAFPGDAVQGETLYADNCQECHGEKATGGVSPEGYESPPLAFIATTFNQMGLPPQLMYALTSLASRMGAPPEMSAFTPDELDDDDLASIAAYILSIAPKELPGPPPEAELPATGDVTLPLPFVMLIGLVGLVAITGGGVLLRRTRKA